MASCKGHSCWHESEAWFECDVTWHVSGSLSICLAGAQWLWMDGHMATRARTALLVLLLGDLLVP